jgi:hypothetical protein
VRPVLGRLQGGPASRRRSEPRLRARVRRLRREPLLQRAARLRIAVLESGDAWIGSSTNGLRIVDHEGRFLADATAVLPGKQVGAVAKDPADESIWVGFRDGARVTRIQQDGTGLCYGGAALGAKAGSAVLDIQVQPAAPGSRRRILVAFRSGAVGVYDGD